MTAKYSIGSKIKVSSVRFFIHKHGLFFVYALDLTHFHKGNSLSIKKMYTALVQPATTIGCGRQASTQCWMFADEKCECTIETLERKK